MMLVVMLLSAALAADPPVEQELAKDAQEYSSYVAVIGGFDTLDEAERVQTELATTKPLGNYTPLGVLNGDRLTGLDDGKFFVYIGGGGSAVVPKQVAALKAKGITARMVSVGRYVAPANAPPLDHAGERALAVTVAKALASRDIRSFAVALRYPADVAGQRFESDAALQAALANPASPVAQVLLDPFVLSDLKHYDSPDDVEVSEAADGAVIVVMSVPAGGCKTEMTVRTSSGTVKVERVSVATWE